MAGSANCYVALGANLGDRLEHLELALRCFSGDPRLDVVAVSHVYETAPVGGPADQPAYLNAAAALRADVSPEDLLAKLLRIESRAGRRRDGVRDAPRELDLDLLDFSGRSIESPELVLPHPRLHLRAFALLPLRDVAPDWVHPVTGRTVDALLEEAVDRRDARRLEGVRLWPLSP